MASEGFDGTVLRGHVFWVRDEKGVWRQIASLRGETGPRGEAGEVFAPHLSPDGTLSFTVEAPGYDALPRAVNLRGPKGDPGPRGHEGAIGPIGPQGEPGVAGASAYEQAVSAGYRGTLREFLDALSETVATKGRAEEALALAKRNNHAHIFGTRAEYEAWLGDPQMTATLNVGDLLYVTETKESFFWDGSGAVPTPTAANLMEIVNRAIARVYRHKGSVATVEALPGDAMDGDVYNVLSDGMNYVWIADEGRWDALGPTIDLTGYATKASVEAVRAEAEAKADKVGATLTEATLVECVVGTPRSASAFARSGDAQTTGYFGTLAALGCEGETVWPRRLWLRRRSGANNSAGALFVYLRILRIVNGAWTVAWQSENAIRMNDYALADAAMGPWGMANTDGRGAIPSGETIAIVAVSDTAWPATGTMTFSAKTCALRGGMTSNMGGDTSPAVQAWAPWVGVDYISDGAPVASLNDVTGGMDSEVYGVDVNGNPVLRQKGFADGNTFAVDFRRMQDAGTQVDLVVTSKYGTARWALPSPAAQGKEYGTLATEEDILGCLSTTVGGTVKGETLFKNLLRMTNPRISVNPDAPAKDISLVPTQDGLGLEVRFPNGQAMYIRAATGVLATVAEVATRLAKTGYETLTGNLTIAMDANGLGGTLEVRKRAILANPEMRLDTVVVVPPTEEGGTPTTETRALEYTLTSGQEAVTDANGERQFGLDITFPPRAVRNATTGEIEQVRPQVHIPSDRTGSLAMKADVAAVRRQIPAIDAAMPEEPTDATVPSTKLLKDYVAAHAGTGGADASVYGVDGSGNPELKNGGVSLKPVLSLIDNEMPGEWMQVYIRTPAGLTILNVPISVDVLTPNIELASQQWVEARLTEQGGGSYTLPVASPEALGGIKVGDGLNISADGTLSVATYVIPAQNGGGPGIMLSSSSGIGRLAFPAKDYGVDLVFDNPILGANPIFGFSPYEKHLVSKEYVDALAARVAALEAKVAELGGTP